MADYTTDEAVLAGLLNDHRLVVHRLPLRTERDYVLPPNSAASSSPVKVRTIPTGASLANVAHGQLPVETLRILRIQVLMNYPSKG